MLPLVAQTLGVGQALELGRKHAGTREVTDFIESIATVAIFAGHTEHGSTLLGAIESMRERIGLRFRLPENQAPLDRAIDMVRSELGELAISSAWATGKRLSPDQALELATDSFAVPNENSGADLSRREMEILELLSKGFTDPEIASALFISARTVEYHVSHIRKKLGVRTGTAALSAALAHGLLTPEQH